MQIEQMNTTTAVKSKDLVTKLREQAAKDPAFNAVCHIFAIRQRTRQQITMANLAQVMHKEGFVFTKSEFEGILRFLATAGVGRLEVDTKGRVKALKDIKLTLQSLGKAAVAKENKIDRFTKSASFQTLMTNVGEGFLPAKPQEVANPAPIKKPKEAPPTPPKEISPELFAVSLNVSLGGKPVNFVLPKMVGAEELGQIMAAIFAKSK